MPKTLYCWRCDTEVPMLTDAEWDRIKALLSNTSISLRRRHDAVLAEYERVTGFTDSNINAVLHHVASLYGPPCQKCGKPLRTPEASFCAACGASVGTEDNS